MSGVYNVSALKCVCNGMCVFRYFRLQLVRVFYSTVDTSANGIAGSIQDMEQKKSCVAISGVGVNCYALELPRVVSLSYGSGGGAAAGPASLNYHVFYLLTEVCGCVGVCRGVKS